jgi:DNA-binding response OmpR family regulator
MARIVIIDDSETVVTLCKAWLEVDGHTVEAVSNPLLAPMVVARTGADLVLIDVQMPTVRGPKVVRILRNAAPDAKLVLHSSIDKPELEAKVRDSGADGYVSKTDDPNVFRARVGMLLT